MPRNGISTGILRSDEYPPLERAAMGMAGMDESSTYDGAMLADTVEPERPNRRDRIEVSARRTDDEQLNAIALITSTLNNWVYGYDNQMVVLNYVVARIKAQQDAQRRELESVGHRN